jgi:hypothetical protein
MVAMEEQRAVEKLQNRFPDGLDKVHKINAVNADAACSRKRSSTSCMILQNSSSRQTGVKLTTLALDFRDFVS